MARHWRPEGTGRRTVSLTATICIRGTSGIAAIAIRAQRLEAPEARALPRSVEAKRVSIELRRPLVNMRGMWPFPRDVQDRLARNPDMVKMRRDLLTGSLDIHLPSVTNRTNRVMQVPTILSTIAPGMVAGIPRRFR